MRLQSSRQSRDLFERCQRGDDDAWRELVEQYENLVYSTALHAGLDHDSAVEVYQQVWVELHRSLLRIREPQALPKWLITTTRRISYRHAVTAGRWVHGVREDMAGETPQADAEMELLEQRHALERALDALDQRCRELLRTLFLSEEKVSYAEVSKATGLAENSIGSLRTRCLGRIRKLLEGVA